MYNTLMQFARKGAVFLASLFFIPLLFGTVSAVSFNQTIGQPEKIKTWIAEGGTYNTFLNVTLTELQENTKEGEGDTLPLNDPELQTIFRNAFPPELLQKSAESFIDGTYNWLDGEVAQPDFRIDLVSAKASLADNLSQYLQNRYNNLPACGPRDIPSELDPFTVSCRVPGYDIGPEAQKLRGDIMNSEEFLGSGVITADDLHDSENPNKPTFFEQAKGLADMYRVAKLAPFLLGVLTLLAALTFIFASDSKRRGAQKVGISLLVVGILLAVSSYIATLALEKVRANLINNGGGAMENFMQNTLAQLISRFGQEINAINLAFGSIFATLAIAIFVTLAVLKRKQGEEPDSDRRDDSHTPADTSQQDPQVATVEQTEAKEQK